MRANEFISNQDQVDEELINELDRIDSSDFTGGDQYLIRNYRKARNPKKLPGGSNFIYDILPGEDDPDSHTINIYDPDSKYEEDKLKKDPSEFDFEFNALKKRYSQIKEYNLPRLVASLDVDNYLSFPLPGAVKVNTITVSEDYRQYGLARALYGIVLAIEKRPLVAGEAQTPDGRRMWLRLSAIPGTEVKGYAVVDSEWYDDLKANPETAKELAAMGVKEIGKGAGAVWLSFDVNQTSGELAPKGSSKFPIYHDWGKKPWGPESSTGLYAVWKGQ